MLVANASQCLNILLVAIAKIKDMSDKSVVNTALGRIIGVKNQVSDTTIITGLWISGVVGTAVIILFCVLQRVSLLYKYRLVANHVRVKPPKLRERGLISFIDWAIKSISVSDVDFILSAGLDALIMVKICALGVQLFLPLCILGTAVLIPLHWTGGASKQLDAYQSGFMRLTMSNIPHGSKVFWVHLGFVYIYLGWAMVLLHWHYHQYLTIRQHYLRKGDDVNLWRALYEEQGRPDPPQGKEPRGSEFINGLLRSVQLIKALMPSGVPVSGPTSLPADGRDEEDEDEEEDEGFAMGGMPLPLELRRTTLGGLDPVGARSPRGSVDGCGRVVHVRGHGDLWAGEWSQSRVLQLSGAHDAPTAGSGTSSRLSRRTLAQAIRNRVTGSGSTVLRASGAQDHGSRLIHRAAYSIGPRAVAAPSDQALQHMRPQLSLDRGGRRGMSPARGQSYLKSSEPVSLQLKESSDAAAGCGLGQEGATDLEAGLGRSVLGADSRSLAPSPCSIDRKGSGLDSDAHLLEWWLERPEATVQSRSRALRAQLEKALNGRDMDLKRPSVGHRKTVNAEFSDGTRVAVLAQHYAVLVTDVTSRRPRLSRRNSRGPAQPTLVTLPGSEAADAVTEVQVTGRRPAGCCLPPWLWSWCDLQYGHQAARKLNPKLPATLSEELLAPVPSGANRTIASMTALARGSTPYHCSPRGSGDGRVVPALLSGNRTCSVNTPSHAQPLSALQTTSTAGRIDLNPDSSPKMAGRWHQAVRGAALLGRAPQGGTWSGSGSGSGSERLIRLLEMMAREAQGKLAAMSTGIVSANPSLSRGSPSSHHTGTGSGTGTSHPVPTSSVRAVALPRSFGTGPSSSHQQLQHQGVPHRFTEPGPAAAAASGGQAAARRGQAASPRAGSGPIIISPRVPVGASLRGVAALGQREGPSTSGTGAGPVAEASLEIREEGQAGDAAGSEGVIQEGNHVAGSAGASAAAGVGAGAGQDGGRTVVDAATSQRQEGSPPGDEVEANPVSQQPTERERLRAAALAGWEVVRQAVWDGRVAELPWRYRYSVVSATFLRLFPEEFDRAIQVVNFKEVDLLLMEVDKHMAQYEYAIKYEEKTGKPLYGCLGFCGLVGERCRVRDHHRDKINDLLVQVRKARVAAANKAHTPSWFVFFRTQRAAAMASQCIIHAEDNRQFRVHPAPGPDEVNWSALWSNFRDRDLRRNLMRPLVVLMVAFPIGIFTGGVTQLDYLLCPAHLCVGLESGSEDWVAAGCTDDIKERESADIKTRCTLAGKTLFGVAHAPSQQLSWEWYCGQKNPIARLLKRLVVAWLPSLLLILWQGMVLPLFFTFVVQISRQARSLSEADRYIAKNMFYFGVFNVFLGGVAGSTIIQGINSAIEKGPSEIFNLVGTYVPTSSNFFINYTMFRVFVSVPVRMLWPHIGIRMYLIRRYLRLSCIITRRERAFLMAPVSPRYGFEVGMVMIIFLIAFAFSVVSPLLMPMAMLFFAISWLFWRWALLYVYVRKYEGGGTMWPFVFNRVLVCLAIFPAFTACVFVTKHAYAQAIVLLVTVPVILVRFHKYCYYRFETGLQAMPLEATVAAPPARVEPWVYTPPPLLSNLAGWHPDWSKCWMGWNMPVMYG
ncbi:hypothetical protein VOLCADRAFT_104236 [Volvox carteri f. nagariensis]|uniref:ERD4-related membrane protein n=1 Tax=Volvox carteri f. nagariensis TaxID=3068 RepID=D8TSA1_VOLCA|nr:uncharacterized protein VOLCADRAFT_104236 [Volvox carteri f. nagariensis]EFJ49655.1 hypothetical protein VOLCADRAFT_104236 [Volvox carteri f. nagariensis]|eukprot:XP_002949162.1 hypothetical protein VOLCADRAFT_104236 [Volvox carteri f. nagariensis]